MIRGKGMSNIIYLKDNDTFVSRCKDLLFNKMISDEALSFHKRGISLYSALFLESNLRIHQAVYGITLPPVDE
ncbi:MAG: hypothetical protein COA78_21975 [Blastopirellula sp.]|nr:MAG: hypothetical protein COA78_21975 [Blastopirellula sp.]